MSLLQMQSKTGMLVKAPALWKPIVEAFFAHSFLQNKTKGWDFLHRGWSGVASFQWYADIFTVVLQGDQEHLLTLKEIHKIPAKLGVFFHPITIWFLHYDSKHNLQLALFGSCKKQ